MEDKLLSHDAFSYSTVSGLGARGQVWEKSREADTSVRHPWCEIRLCHFLSGRRWAVDLHLIPFYSIIYKTG